MTCLCLTRNRREWLPKAISAFLAQAYEHRELLILADGKDVQDLIPDDTRIRHISAIPPMSIGAKRNLGCELAAGSVIAHWDDDDYSAPQRLSDQIRRLHETGKAVTGYHSMRFKDGSRWWRYAGRSSYSLGTSLCYRRDWWQRHRFPCQQLGEDNVFTACAAAAGELSAVDAGDLMYASIHDGNTSPRNPADAGSNWHLLI